jgi:RNA polymerase sigma-70 factor (ECF subfamily)
VDWRRIQGDESPRPAIWLRKGRRAGAAPRRLGWANTAFRDIRGGETLRIADLEATLAAYRPRALRLATNVLRNRDDAEEAVQEAFLCAWRFSRNYKANGSSETWLHRIVINQSIMMLRKRKSRCWQFHDSLSDPSLNGQHRSLRSGCDIERDAISGDLAGQVMMLAEKLPSSQREAIHAVAEQRYSPGSCADRSSTPKVRKHRAIAKLRTWMPNPVSNPPRKTSDSRAPVT